MGFPIINLWGVRFTSVFSTFSVMAGWNAEILFMLFFASEYEANWLIGVPIIIEAHASYSLLHSGIRKLSN